jgi:predicted SAM-dependent methyltransferase
MLKSAIKIIRFCITKIEIVISSIYFRLFVRKKLERKGFRINLCCGAQRVEGYFGIDYNKGANLRLDLLKWNLPFHKNTCQAIVCMSAINYFTYSRASEIIKDCHRVLKPNGILRIGVQDLELIAKHYVGRNKAFFYQKTSNNVDRFPGATIADKFVSWFYEHPAGNSYCKYFYDFESLSNLVKKAGFRIIERKKYQDSRLSDIEKLDNRPDQMFFLEAIK